MEFKNGKKVLTLFLANKLDLRRPVGIFFLPVTQSHTNIPYASFYISPAAWENMEILLVKQKH